MERPRVICHMASSLDGRILPERWSPRDAHDHQLYEELHRRMHGRSWIVGRTTAQEFARGQPYSTSAARVEREAWLPCRDASSYAFMIDAHGKIAWGRKEVDGEPIVVLLTEAVSDDHLAGLRSDGVGYMFAGRDAFDLAEALCAIRRELNVEQLMLEGGGVMNGAFVRAGLVDEISLMLVPAIDGRPDAPAVFDAVNATAALAPISRVSLVSHEVFAGGIVWLRYQIET